MTANFRRDEQSQVAPRIKAVAFFPDAKLLTKQLVAIEIRTNMLTTDLY